MGHEAFFIAYLKDDFEKLGLTVFHHEGVVEIHGNNPNSALLSAHCDRHGLISLGNGEYAYAAQYMREVIYGEPNLSSQKEVAAIAKRFDGEDVFAYDPLSGGRIGEGVIEACDHCIADKDAVFFVHGMLPAPTDTPVAYARTARFKDGHLKGQIDNALSLAVVYVLFQRGFQGSALLTIEEEIGKSWLHMAAYMEAHGIETQSLLVLDTSPYNESEPVDTGRVIFRNRDKSGVFNAALVDFLKARCAALGLPLQVKDEYLLAQGKTEDQLGSTELGRLVKEKENRWNGASIQIPTLMYHTSNETTSAVAITNFYTFLEDILIKNVPDILAFKEKQV